MSEKYPSSVNGEFHRGAGGLGGSVTCVFCLLFVFQRVSLKVWAVVVALTSSFNWNSVALCMVGVELV
eukprot:169571-Prymnesium_polylepis.1